MVEKIVDFSWTVLTDRDLPYALTLRGTLDFETGVERLGGGGEAADRPAGHLLFAYQGTGLDAVELFFLKLSFFQQALHLVYTYHRRLDRPHLDLSPGSFALDRSDLVMGLPSLWGLQLGFADGSSARPRILPGGISWIAPPTRHRPPYGSPAVARARSIEEQTGRLTLERWVEDREGRYRLEARLMDGNGIFPQPLAEDWIRLRFPRPPLVGISELLARLDPRSFGDTGSIAVTSEPVFLEPEQRSRAEAFTRQDLGEVGYRVYPVLGPEEDLYSLGIFLLRLLLVDDQQTLAELDRVLVAHRENREGRSVEDDHLRLIASHPEMFAVNHVFFAKRDRLESRPNPIPPELWQQALLLALGLTEYCRGGGFDDREFDRPKERLADLVRRLRLVLFRAQPVHLEVHSVIAEMLTSDSSDSPSTH